MMLEMGAGSRPVSDSEGKDKESKLPPAGALSLDDSLYRFSYLSLFKKKKIVQ